MTLLNNLYSITGTEPDSRAFTIALRRDCAIYGAHFPGQPVTPGVCIIQVAGELLEAATGLKLALREVKNAKFLAVINPDITASVTYTMQKLEIDGTTSTVKASVTVTDPTVTYAKLSLSFSII